MSNDVYRIGRGIIPSLRLNLQNYVWKETLGYDLHPRIETNCSKLRVADVGTGTGIWLAQLSRKLSSSARLDGFDVSSVQFPHQSSLPTNVRLHVGNALEPVPQHLRGKYDIVHLRLFLAVVTNDDPELLLQHAYDLLKPGGYLQWCEWDNTIQRPIGPNAEDPESAVAKVCKAMNYTPKSWVARLPHTFENKGISCVAVDRMRELPWHRGLLLDNSCLVAEELGVNMLQKQLSLEERKSFQELPGIARQAMDDAKDGCYFSQTFQVVVGKKNSE